MRLGLCILCFSRPTTLAPRVASRRLHHTVEHYITENDEPRVQSPDTLASLTCVMPLPRGERTVPAAIPGTPEIEATKWLARFVRSTVRATPCVPPSTSRRACTHTHTHTRARGTVRLDRQIDAASNKAAPFAKLRKQRYTRVRSASIRQPVPWFVARFARWTSSKLDDKVAAAAGREGARVDSCKPRRDFSSATSSRSFGRYRGRSTNVSSAHTVRGNRCSEIRPAEELSDSGPWQRPASNSRTEIDKRSGNVLLNVVPLC